MNGMPPERASRRAGAGLLAWAALALLASGAVVWRMLGAEAFWRGAAHESEARSLLWVMLFPGHALRELPHVFLLALCWLAGARPAASAREALGQLGRAGAAFLLWGAALFAWEAAEAGAGYAWLQLGQSFAAPGLTGAGMHFRYHLLSDVALGAAFFGAGRLLARGPRRPFLAAGVGGAALRRYAGRLGPVRRRLAALRGTPGARGLRARRRHAAAAGGAAAAEGGRER
ncbi:MAG: hypothetical protein M5U26_19435 [Planctomycetota bacterium]|nr:hypothetical protein [Planctomycetota bacterium]